jgi:hypothetical protein
VSCHACWDKLNSDDVDIKIAGCPFWSLAKLWRSRPGRGLGIFGAGRWPFNICDPASSEWAAPPAQWNILGRRGVFAEASWPILLASTHSTSVSSQWEMRAGAQNEMAPRPILWVGCPLFPPAPFPQILPKSQTSSTVDLNPRPPILYAAPEPLIAIVTGLAAYRQTTLLQISEHSILDDSGANATACPFLNSYDPSPLKLATTALPILWPIRDAATSPLVWSRSNIVSRFYSLMLFMLLRCVW